MEYEANSDLDLKLAICTNEKIASELFLSFQHQPPVMFHLNFDQFLVELVAENPKTLELCSCTHSFFVAAFCRRHFILLSPSPACQFCLLEDNMIMEVMLHHICQVQQMIFCSANHLPKTNCLYIKHFFSAHPSSISFRTWMRIWGCTHNKHGSI